LSESGRVIWMVQANERTLKIVYLNLVDRAAVVVVVEDDVVLEFPRRAYRDQTSVAVPCLANICRR